MRDDVSSDGFGAVFGKAHSVWVGNHLVGQDYRDSKLFRHPRKLSQEPAWHTLGVEYEHTCTQNVGSRRELTGHINRTCNAQNLTKTTFALYPTHKSADGAIGQNG